MNGTNQFVLDWNGPGRLAFLGGKGEFEYFSLETGTS